jgi:periplasmic divalent cation tolerance protein
MDDYVIVMTTVPDDGTLGGQLAKALVEERLAACVSMLPVMHSTYRWQDQIATDTERQLLIKTRRGHVEAIKARLRALHSYEVPEVLVLPVVEGATAYLDWIAAST